MLMGYGHSMLRTMLPRWEDESIWNPEVRQRATSAERLLLGEPLRKHEKVY